MKTQQKRYFLAANSCEGFVSHFGTNYFKDGSYHCYIIKGGPGTGKSSFMKKLAAYAQTKGFSCVLCPCSSDPDSLDGVIIEEKKIIILDGTAPHVIEPTYAGVCEDIVNLGEFWDSKKLIKNADKIIKVADLNKTLHRRAAGYLTAAGQVMKDNLRVQVSALNLKKTDDFAFRTVRNLIRPKSLSRGSEYRRFIGGTTPQGIITYPETLLDEAQTRIIISDRYGAVSNTVMQRVREFALSGGYDIITLENPFLPETLTDHIVIPSLSLAFLREDDQTRFPCDTRRIHTRRFTDNAVLSSAKGRLLINRRIFSGLIQSACETLSEAKAVHDVLEKYYIDAMDFAALNTFAEKFATNILD